MADAPKYEAPSYFDAVKDRVGDLAHHAMDLVSGALSASSAKAAPAYSAQSAAQHLGTGIASKGADLISNRQSQIDKAVDDASN